MAQSKYDTDGDGVCDAPECKDILTITDREDPYPEQSALLIQFLGADRAHARREAARAGHDVQQVQRRQLHHALCASRWGKDYADGITFGEPLFSSAGLWESCCNYSLLGASADQLSGWGYDVTSVPSVDDKVDECRVGAG